MKFTHKNQCLSKKDIAGLHKILKRYCTKNSDIVQQQGRWIRTERVNTSSRNRLRKLKV